MQAQVADRRGLLADRNFASLWLAQAVSGFGDNVTTVALAALVWDLSRSSLATALILIVTSVPHAFFGFFAGPLSDALGRRRTLILCDLIRAAVIGVIPVAIALHLPLGSVYFLVLIATFCAALFNPTRLAILPDLMPRRALTSGNSLIQITDRVMEIAGKAAGGLLFVIVGPAVFLIDAVSFLFSAAMLRRISIADEGPWAHYSIRSVVMEAGSGLRFIRGDPALWANLLFSLVAQASAGVANSLIAVYLFRELRAGLESFGAAEAAHAIGVVVFGLLMPLTMAQVRKGRLVIVGFAAYGAVLISLAVAPGIEVAMALFVLLGAANVLFLVPNITIYQERTPAQMRGRVFSSRYALLNLTWLPVMFLSGAAAESVPAGLLIGVAGAFTLVTAVAGLFIPAVRDVD